MLERVKIKFKHLDKVRGIKYVGEEKDKKNLKGK